MFRVRNYGPTRTFATCVGNIRIPGKTSIDIEDEKAAAELAEFQFMEVEGARPMRPQDETAEPFSFDYSVLPINTLRRIAARFGFKDVFLKKKTDLIKLLQEQ